MNHTLPNDPTVFPIMKGWQLTRLDGESTPEESKEIEGLFTACLGLLHAGYSLKQAREFILMAPARYEALKAIEKKLRRRLDHLGLLPYTNDREIAEVEGLLESLVASALEGLDE